MDHHLFWLTEEQFTGLAPHLPTDERGKPRVDGLRVISGIIHVLKWAPPETVISEGLMSVLAAPSA